MERCAYHTSKTAIWHCQECNLDLCGKCIINKPLKKYGNRRHVLHLCPHCHANLSKITTRDPVSPYWHMLPTIFGYPLQAMPMILLLICSAVIAIFSIVPVMNWMITAFIWAVWIKYCSAALTKTSQGYFEAPDLTGFSEDLELGGQVILLNLIFGVFCLLIMHNLTLRQTLATLLILGVTFPAMLMVLNLRRSLMRVFNPGLTLEVALKIGPSYWVLCLILLSIGTLPLTIALKNSIPAYIQQPALFACLALCQLFSYNFIGYIMLQYHERLGLKINIETLAEIEPGSHPQLDRLIAQGKLEQALNWIDRETGGRVNDQELAETYFQLLKRLRQNLNQHGADYLHLLQAANQRKKMAEVYTDCINADADFAPDPDIIFSVAEFLNEARNFKAAARTYLHLIEHYPETECRPRASYNCAVILNEELNNRDEALQVINEAMLEQPDFLPVLEKYYTHLQAAS